MTLQLHIFPPLSPKIVNESGVSAGVAARAVKSRRHEQILWAWMAVHSTSSGNIWSLGEEGRNAFSYKAMRDAILKNCSKSYVLVWLAQYHTYKQMPEGAKTTPHLLLFLRRVIPWGYPNIKGRKLYLLSLEVITYCGVFSGLERATEWLASKWRMGVWMRSLILWLVEQRIKLKINVYVPFTGQSL